MLDPHERKKKLSSFSHSSKADVAIFTGTTNGWLFKGVKTYLPGYKNNIHKRKAIRHQKCLLSLRSHAENTVLLLTSSLTLLKNAEYLSSHLRCHKTPLSGLWGEKRFEEVSEPSLALLRICISGIPQAWVPCPVLWAQGFPAMFPVTIPLSSQPRLRFCSFSYPCA